MSSAVITPQFRALGWNVNLLCGPDGDRFAGLFHPPASDSLTFRDIVSELRLCFEFLTAPRTQNSDESSDPCEELAFENLSALDGPLQPLNASTSPAPCPLRMIYGQDLDKPISTPAADPSTAFSRPPSLRLRVVRHTECSLAPEDPLTAHLRAGCATHIPYPSLRRDERYLPPNKASRDPQVARLPYRKTIRPSRASQSPPKRSASGSVSPTKDLGRINEAEDVEGLVAPPSLDIPLEQARQTMAAFRTSCLAASTTCAVTGKGRSWYFNPSVGPAVQACHIVPQQHYHVYPVPTSIQENRQSPRRLRQAWDCTWSLENGILLLSHLHELFDARLFSIHPDTGRIRVFMPYDVLLDYHGSIAHLSSDIDRKALRHHYEMCCIENMAAKMPLSESLASEDVSRSAASGAISPFDSGSNTPVISSVTSPRNILSPKFCGDPSKRSKPAPDQPTDMESINPLTLDGSSASNSFRHDSNSPYQMRREGHVLHEMEEQGRKKRRRISENNSAVEVYDVEKQIYHGVRDPYWEGCITRWNSQAFLADVNWELRHFV
ncbi:hypothetical protein CEP52_017416 [Fusarium oligoseptatum]|uniref:HNH nuclease domain-containing protein n=1 Tax=Fusarium oligoseptatum TaxID=2604345 RepID=A0A428RRV7_9HYPO|nr:hypothetical protein CEP52_017416 [Fusarium oligoseptatum]